MKNTLYETGIVPVIKLKDLDKAEKLAKALIEGGINFAEVTFRAENADEAIKRMLKAYPSMYVGAGTVLTMEEAKKAVEAGAKFIVCPGFDKEIVEYAQKSGVQIYPGCVTPTEIQMACKAGLEILKFFPSKQFGGVGTLKALGAPFAKVKFMPTGGIDLNNLEEYISCKNVVACGGSFIVKESLIDSENWSEITRLSREARTIVDRIRRENE